MMDMYQPDETSQNRCDREVLWTWERMHDKTELYAGRSDDMQLAGYYEVRMNGYAIDMFGRYTRWVLNPFFPVVTWLN